MTADTRKVVVALDGSPAATMALPAAARVARQLGATVEALFVAADGAALRDARTSVEAAVRAWDVHLVVTTGDVAARIIEAADEPDTALVALTMHGREVDADHRLGSVAERVVAHTKSPVLLVKPETAADVRGLRYLVVPMDGTPRTAAAIRPVFQLATDLGANVDLLYVAEPGQAPEPERGALSVPQYVDQAHHEWPAWASEMTHRLAKLCAECPDEVPVRFFLAEGDPGDEIARFAAVNNADAIVLVRRSRFQPDRARVIRSVLHQTGCMVIIVGG